MIISHKKILLIMFLFFIPLVVTYAQDNTIFVNVTIKLINQSNEAIENANVELISGDTGYNTLKEMSDKNGRCVFTLTITQLDKYSKVRVYSENVIIYEDVIELDATKLVKIDENTQALPTITLNVSIPGDLNEIKNKIVAGLITKARKLITTERNIDNFELALGFAKQAKSTNDKQVNSDPTVDKFVAEIFEMYLQYLYADSKIKEGIDLLSKIKLELPNFSKLSTWEERFNLKTLPDDIRDRYEKALDAIETGNVEVAVNEFSALVKLKDSVVPYYQNIFENQLLVSKEMVVSKILEQALTEYEKENYDGALQLLSKISQYTQEISPAALAIEEVVRGKLGINSRSETPDIKNTDMLDCELTAKGKNKHGYEEFIRSTDGMTVILMPEREITIGDLSGLGTSDEKPNKKLKLRSFYYDKYEVSNAQYAKFLNSVNPRGLLIQFYNIDSISAQIELADGVFRPKPEKGDYPVQNVSWFGANAYSLWAWGHNWRDFEGADCLLPTTPMYECVAVCTPDLKRVYPWGNEYKQEYVVCNRQKTYQWDVVPTAKTNEFIQSSSYCGVLNLSGNVWEWMANAGAYQLYSNNKDEAEFLLNQANSEHTKEYFIKLKEHIEKFIEANPNFDKNYPKMKDKLPKLIPVLEKIIENKEDGEKEEEFKIPKFLYPDDGENEKDASKYSNVFADTREYRGGGYTSSDSKVRSTYRTWNYPTRQTHYLGFRTAIFSETQENHEIDPESLPKAKFDPIVKGFEYLGKNKMGFREFKRPKDGMIMIEVPAGDFQMGSEIVIDAKPEHLVSLDMYLIDKYEVTNAQFEMFLKEYGSERIKETEEYSREKIIKESIWGFIKNKDGQMIMSGDPKAPVVGVTWYGAKEYAKWAKVDLPSEAQWEKAARSNSDGPYPWGSDEPNEKRANFLATHSLRPSNFSSFEEGTSPYGCFNMAGNVWEWCEDYYDDSFYSDQESKKLNPMNKKIPKYSGTTEGNRSRIAYNRVLRGGGSNSQAANLRVYVRKGVYENTGSQYIGFRCGYNGTYSVIDKTNDETDIPSKEDENEEKQPDDSSSALKDDLWSFAKFQSNKKYGADVPESFDIEKISTNDDGIEFYKRKKDGMIVVRVPGGYFKVGDVFDIGDYGERVSKYIWVPEFFFDTMEISNKQYCLFLNSINANYTQALKFYKLNNPNANIALTTDGFTVMNYKSNEPVNNVTFDGANAYSMWVWNQGFSNYDNNSCIPTEAMFEKAASYNWSTMRKNLFTFGNEIIDRSSFAFNRNSFMNVNSENSDVSYLGVRHLSDNISEWCVDAYTGETCGKLHQLSIELPQREYMLDPALMGRVVKGGSIADIDYKKLRCSYRFSMQEDSSSEYIGFRCAIPTGYNLSPTKSIEDREIDLQVNGSNEFDAKSISENFNKMKRVKRSKDNMIMVKIEKGDYYISDAKGNLYTKQLDEYYMDETEVTVSMFCKFLNEYKSTSVKEGIYKGKIIFYDDLHEQFSKLKTDDGEYYYKPKKGWEVRPISDISWYGAYEYAKWVGCELPTEAQFEAAGRGTTQNKYPWGNDDPTFRHANFKLPNRVSLPGKVGSYRVGNSVFGVKDLSGNVWEWCQDFYNVEKLKFEKTDFPCDFRYSEKMVIKGGCFNSDADAISISSRRGVNTELIYSLIGFRCVYNLGVKTKNEVEESNIR